MTLVSADHEQRVYRPPLRPYFRNYLLGLIVIVAALGGMFLLQQQHPELLEGRVVDPYVGFLLLVGLVIVLLLPRWLDVLTTRLTFTRDGLHYRTWRRKVYTDWSRVIRARRVIENYRPKDYLIVDAQDGRRHHIPLSPFGRRWNHGALGEEFMIYAPHVFGDSSSD